MNSFLMLPFKLLWLIILLKYCLGNCLIYLGLDFLPRFLPGIRIDFIIVIMYLIRFKLLKDEIKVLMILFQF